MIEYCFILAMVLTVIAIVGFFIFESIKWRWHKQIVRERLIKYVKHPYLLKLQFLSRMSGG